jgi:ATP-binding cassette, subfamily C (CFTR/MRP), member 4
LLQGTIKENIDPFSEKTEEQIWNVLKEVNLFVHIDKMTDKLETVVSESNNLFSVG